MSDIIAAPQTKARRQSPEHNLQIKIKVFVRDCVMGPHVFLAFDRSKKQSRFQHSREKARGLRAGTPDTVLMIGGRALWCELKAPGNKPNDEQNQVGADIIVAGGIWFWAASVEEYRQHLVRLDVPIHWNATVHAMRHDAVLDGARIAARNATPRKASKPRAARPSAAQIRRVGLGQGLPR